MISEYK